MHHPLRPHSSIRIFAFSGFVTIATLLGVFFGMGPGASFVALILIIVEIAFSFDNAIVNAKILTHMSRFWQTMFLTIGALIAIFGMRLLFPLVLVALTAGLSLGDVVNLALHNPDAYSQHLQKAHVVLSSFGGAFLLVLALDFFIDPDKQVSWFIGLERQLQKLAKSWAPALITLLVVLVVALLPMNTDKRQTILAGLVGILAYSFIHGLTEVLGKAQARRRQVGTYAGMMAFVSFLYLQILDGAFSFDSVLGAFAVTKDVILIALGLGVGAFWVRSLTVFMVRRGTLSSYRYIEHGAYYTIAVLALTLFLGVLVNVPQLLTGVVGFGIILASLIASQQAIRAR